MIKDDTKRRTDSVTPARNSGRSKKTVTKSGIDFFQFPSLFPAEVLMEELGDDLGDDLNDQMDSEDLKNEIIHKFQVNHSIKRSSVTRKPLEQQPLQTAGKRNANTSATQKTEKTQTAKPQVAAVSEPVQKNLTLAKNNAKQKDSVSVKQSNVKQTKATKPSIITQNDEIQNPITPVGTRTYATLSTFVEGISNRLARTAAELAIAQPGKMNPIYIHGGTSVGKTHLLEGICSDLRKRKNRKPVLFMTAEQFTTTFIESLRQGAPTFRNKFRGISALLIDDIQFFTGKASTQTELLSIIDTLKNQGVQLVFSGNAPLKELGGLRSELLSRLESGMVCGIESPERETLLMIFRQMVTQREIKVPEEVCRFVASRLNNHARQLSGALNRLHAVHLATRKPITVQMAAETLDDLIRSNRKTIKLTDIDKVVCDTFGLETQSLQSKSRAKVVSQPRMLAMWLARKYTRSALSEIGQFFGDRSHSTVVSAQKKVDKWVNDDVPLSCIDHDSPISELLQKVERLLG
ncbi:MAG: DnaA ATPase domain-containing protein [Thermoguttaceae bacterium]